MLAGHICHQREREKALALGMRELASELRLIDVVELVTYIRAEKFSHIENLVNSAAEMCFRQGTVTFGSSADVHLDWGAAPTIWFDMEFANRGIKVYFSLVLESCQAGIEINYMTFGDAGRDGAENTRRLAEAIEDARTRYA